jgi:ADP-ribose pyrophosphatase
MRRTLHKNKVFRVEEITSKIRDRKVKSYIIKEPNTVAVLPITKNGYILLEEQYRIAIDKKIYEIPAGHIEKNETPLQAARRELEEETGFIAKKMKFLIYFYPTPGIINKKEYLYLAEGLSKGKISLDKDEDIITKEMRLDNALKFIKSGRITDAKTILAILYYKRFVNKS